MVLLAVPTLACATGFTVHLYAVGFCVALFTVFFDTADQAYLPALVQSLGATLAVLANVATFLASAVLLRLIRTQEAAHGSAERQPLWLELRQGMRFVLGNAYLRSIAPSTGSSNLVASAAQALVILFATRELGLSRAALSAALSLANVAGLVGALTASRVAMFAGLGRAIVLGSAGSGLWLVPLALATRARRPPGGPGRLPGRAGRSRVQHQPSKPASSHHPAGPPGPR